MVSIELTRFSLHYPVLHPVELSVKGTFKQLATGGRIWRRAVVRSRSPRWKTSIYESRKASGSE